MQRIFPHDFRRNYFSMTLQELQDLQTYFTSTHTDQDTRLALTSFTDFRFKVNDTNYATTTMVEQALLLLKQRIDSLKPQTSPKTSPKTSPNPSLIDLSLSQKERGGQVVTESSGKQTDKSKTDKSKSKQGSQSNRQTSLSLGEGRGEVENGIVPGVNRVGSISKTGVNSKVLKDTTTPSLNGRAGEGQFPHPLIVGPLRHEATHVQELYYLPLAQLHNQLFILTQQAIKQAIALGWQGEDVKTWRPSSRQSSAVPVSPFSANTERASLQQRITRLDNQLQNFWNRYHLATDEINGVAISDETREEIDKETRACGSPSLGSQMVNGTSVNGKSLGSYTKKEIEAGLYPSDLSLEELITARQLRNKKLLNRRDRQKTESHKQTIIEAITELHDWQIPIEQGQVKTALYYGYEVPLDWQRHKRTDEERRLAHNADQKRSNDKKQSLKREMKKAFEEEARAQFKTLKTLPIPQDPPQPSR